MDIEYGKGHHSFTLSEVCVYVLYYIYVLYYVLYILHVVLQNR